MYRKVLTLVAGGLLLGACDIYGPMTHNMSAFDWGDPKPLEALEAADRTGTEFTAMLADGYQEMSEAEQARRDWRDSQRWARKGELAASGAVVHPELPDRWDLELVNYAVERVDGTTYKDLYEVREDLMETFYYCGTREKDPATSAQAQLAFDCLVEELDEGWDENAIGMCRTTLQESLAKLKTYCQPMEFTILFDFNGDTLNAEGTGVVAEIAKIASDKRAVTLTGWADTVGNAGYNQALSSRRVNAVRAALVEAGVPADMISETAMGNRDLPVSTGPGVKNQQNRSVLAVVAQ
ncbi:OmpA family protein [Rhodospirillum sp. A1_3_36]|uniref:OmpA family protein n=1 Tax=Rhodospirillum sp. A1_3_36 TaxID=3391666 RepID=UPI0039A5162C